MQLSECPIKKPENCLAPLSFWNVSCCFKTVALNFHFSWSKPREWIGSERRSTNQICRRTSCSIQTPERWRSILWLDTQEPSRQSVETCPQRSNQKLNIQQCVCAINFYLSYPIFKCFWLFSKTRLQVTHLCTVIKPTLSFPNMNCVEFSNLVDSQLIFCLFKTQIKQTSLQRLVCPIKQSEKTACQKRKKPIINFFGVSMKQCKRINVCFFLKWIA